MYHKRQRRQAAGLVVQSFSESFFGMGRKSTAQPRPAVHIPPKGIGPIEEPNQNDVLCGRGGRINSHEGNIQFRNMVSARKKEYLSKSTKKLEKAHIAAKIIEDIRTMDPPGRFLKEDPGDGFWYDIGDAKAIKKAGQALREDAPGIREELDEVSSGDEANSPAVVTTPKAAPARVSAPPPARVSPGIGFVSGRGNPHDRQQRSTAWSTGPPSAPYGQPLAPFQPYPSHGAAYTSLSSPQSTYKVPPQFFSQGGPNKSGALSSTAKEAMKLSSASGVPGPRPPTSHVAFGRTFTPTEMSSGTVSTISGMSGVSGPNSNGFRLTSERTMSLRLSQLSDLSLRTPSSTAGLSRSFSYPELTDASYSALMAEEKDVLVAVETGAANLVDPMKTSSSSGSSGQSSGRFGRPAAAVLRSRTQSGASAVSMASGGSQRSRLSSIMSVGSDSSWMNPYLMSRLSENSGSSTTQNDEQSLRSAMSEVSYDFLALDLAEPGV